MARHKAPTAVTLATTESESNFSKLVAKYWMYVAITGGALVVWVIYSSSRDSSLLQHNREAWGKLLAVTTPDPLTGQPTGSTPELRRVSGELNGTVAGPWALYLAATT